jgi:coenzyme F420-0:L-glutamate ligase/coenzyme F420-1:gamma-L-glutamate ligase
MAMGEISDRELRLVALAGVPLVAPGDDLATLVVCALDVSGERLRDGDVLILAQKIVSKAEGREVRLSSVTPSARAVALARELDKDPRLIELILAESVEILRLRRDVIIVAHRLGFVMANAGVDLSNLDQRQEDPVALLLPADPDRTCAVLRQRLRETTGAEIGVIINDSHGRAWRNGTVGVAIGAAGVPALVDLRGRPDLYSRPLRVTEVGVADELAAAASLVMGQADEGRPIVLARGMPYPLRAGSAQELVRPKAIDLFR